MKNYPSIFERTKAYEDGNNGEITPSTTMTTAGMSRRIAL